MNVHQNKGLQSILLLLYLHIFGCRIILASHLSPYFYFTYVPDDLMLAYYVVFFAAPAYSFFIIFFHTNFVNTK